MIPYFVALKQSHKYQIISGKAYQSRPVELGAGGCSAWGLFGLYFFSRLSCRCWRFSGSRFSLRAGAVPPSAGGDTFERYTAAAFDSGILQAA